MLCCADVWCFCSAASQFWTQLTDCKRTECHSTECYEVPGIHEDHMTEEPETRDTSTGESFWARTPMTHAEHGGGAGDRESHQSHERKAYYIYQTTAIVFRSILYVEIFRRPHRTPFEATVMPTVANGCYCRSKQQVSVVQSTKGRGEHLLDILLRARSEKP